MSALIGEKKRRYMDYQIDELPQEEERERHREKEVCMDRMDGWIEGKPHLAKKRLFGLPRTTEGESNAIDLLQPMTGQNSAIIMTNERSLHQMRNCQ